MIDLSIISLLDLAGFISEHLRNKGIDAVLVGGACVTIYSINRYQSYDLDYVTYEDMRKVDKALNEVGFIKKDKYFKHKECPWFIEFVSPPVAIGNESVQKFNSVRTSLGTIKMLHPTDSVKDRLAGYYHWNDRQSLEQAINICLEQTIDISELKRWSLSERHEKKFQVFEAELNKKLFNHS